VLGIRITITITHASRIFMGRVEILYRGAVKWEVKRGRSGVDDHGDSGKVCAGQKNNETPRKRISMIVEKDSPGIVQLFQPKCSDRSIIRKFSTGNTLNQWKQENEQEKDE
jgi:hypothetical protein